ncbi:MAG TPA: c-type cytochrome biogenesis protein CcsB [Nocardioidaceae bacterium]|nr:c-type cytochrome biogenesis protein CcsB [Nocardioidaceae bacterium]
MNIQDWAVVSDRAVMFAGIVYALAFVSHIVEWAISRTLAPALVAAGSAPADVPADTAVDEGRELQAEKYGRIGIAMTVIAAGLHLVSLVSRGLATDPVRVPWGNMYEFTLAGTFGVVAIYLLLMRRYGLRWLGMVVTGFLVVILMLDQLVLYKDAGPVMPALHSYWLVIHVLAAVIATGTFFVGGMLSALYLVKERVSARGPLNPRGFLANLPSLESMDRVSYRLHAIGFPIWTFAALVAGPIWAKYAWGRYWGWDPKEVWAFITWVVYAGYLHARATAGYKGRVAAIIALVALATLLFNFVGINFVFGGGSMHSYAK